MKSTSETGHAKNVAGLKKIIEECLALQKDYQPSNSAITLTALSSTANAAQEAMEAVSNAKPVFDNAIDVRNIEDNNMSVMITRSMSSLISSGASEQSIANAKTIYNKIKGYSKKNKNGQPETPPIETKDKTITAISISQQSFDMRLAHFGDFIEILKNEPKYQPNEPDLTITALETMYNNLNTLNKTAIDVSIVYKNAIIARNKILYAPGIGIIDLSKKVKAYLLSVLGATEPVYKRIKAIPFKKLI
jgi:hypothetical protein